MPRNKEINFEGYEPVADIKLSSDGPYVNFTSPVIRVRSRRDADGGVLVVQPNKRLFESQLFARTLAKIRPAQTLWPQLEDDSLQAGGFTLRVLTDKKNTIHDYNLGLFPSIKHEESTEALDAIKQLNSQLQRSLRSGLTSSPFQCYVIGSREIRLVMEGGSSLFSLGGDTTLFRLTSEGHRVNRQLTGLEQLTADGSWQQEGNRLPCRLDLIHNPFCFEVKVSEFALPRKRRTRENPKIISVVLGVEFSSDDFGSLDNQMRFLISQGIEGEHSLRQLVNPYLRLAVRQ
ncbi:hypothetical protein HYV21_01805 [Candidatus Microgenomates bacterium]|nr:hypothetical protein [Candidatus Microgenomates bacterium]